MTEDGDGGQGGGGGGTADGLTVESGRLFVVLTVTVEVEVVIVSSCSEDKSVVTDNGGGIMMETMVPAKAVGI